MKVKIQKGRAVGTVWAPPSKSYLHRALISASLAEGTSVIQNVSDSQDIAATLDCISAFGASYTQEENCFLVHGNGGHCSQKIVCPCRESGSTLRFFIPLSLVCQNGGTFLGSSRLMERGISVYKDLFEKHGIVVVQQQPDSLTVEGKLLPARYEIPGDVSSQFISGLLFALPLLDRDSEIQILPPQESKAYITITRHVLEQFGIVVHQPKEDTFIVPGNQRYHTAQLTVEGDWSNAAFLLAFSYIGGDVQVQGLSPKSLQGDRVCTPLLERLCQPNAVISLADCPDLGPILFAFAAAKHGATFTDTKRLAIKESDRVHDMINELQKFGATATIEENQVVLHKSPLHAPQQRLNGHNDHRIVMSLSWLASFFGAEIEGAEAVQKSFPHFFEVLKSLGLEVSYDL